MNDFFSSPLTLQLVFLLQDKILGRRTITDLIGASESSVRTELEKLRKNGFVEMKKRGTYLTERAREAFSHLLEIVLDVKNVDFDQLVLDDYSLVALIRGIDELRWEVWRYRDLAVREGATGMVLLKVDQNQLQFADTGEKITTKNSEDAVKLEKHFPQWKKGNYFIIVFGPDKLPVERGLWQIIGKLVSSDFQPD